MKISSKSSVPSSSLLQAGYTPMTFDAGPILKDKVWISLKILNSCFIKSSFFRESIIDLNLLHILLDLALCLGFSDLIQQPNPNSMELQILEQTCNILTLWTSPSFTSKYPKLLVFKDQVSKYQIMSILEEIKKKVLSNDDHLSAIAVAKMKKSNDIRLEKYIDAMEKWKELKTSIEEHQNQVDSLLHLLYPKDPFILSYESLSNHAALPIDTLHSSTFSLEINLKSKVKIVENESNKIIFDQIREHRYVLLALSVKISDLLSLSTKVQDPDLKRHESFLKALIDSKAALQTILEKSREVLDEAIVEDSNSDEDEFEEIDESFQLSSIVADKKGKKVDNSKIVPVYSFTGLKPVFSSTELISPIKDEKPTRSPTLNNESNLQSESNHSLLEKAPFVEWQPDLDHWTTKTVTFADITSHSGLEFKHRFLGEPTEASHDKVVGSQAIEMLRKRIVFVDNDDTNSRIEYPICGVRLKNGKGLCQRRDMIKCPFHGIIRPRDEIGNLLTKSIGEKDESIPMWTELEKSVLESHPIISSSRVQTSDIVVKESARSRLAKKSKKISSSASRSGIADGSNLVQELRVRDRQVFKW